MKTITDRQAGLFPQPREISLRCSCPDWADMCKHVAAVLYGIGARLDHEPELLFLLRHVDHSELISKMTLKTPIVPEAKSKGLAGQDLSSLFGIEIETDAKGEMSAETNAGAPIGAKTSVQTKAVVRRRTLRKKTSKKKKKSSPKLSKKLPRASRRPG